MATISAFMVDYSGLFHHKHPSKCQTYKKIRPENSNCATHKRIARARYQCFFAKKYGTKCAMSVGRNHHELSFDDELPKEPFWLTFMKEALLSLKSLFQFLIEQPSQLKYIEWPSFQSTLKTASLTLVLVAMLIVALTSVDSALSYLLALLLRRTP